MKTRVIHTKFWSDNFISELTPNEKLLFLYFLTNERVNMIHLYECPNRIIVTDTGVGEKELELAKRKFEEADKIYFYKGYILLKNAMKYDKYEGRINERAKELLLSEISQDVLDWYAKVMNNSLEGLFTPKENRIVKRIKDRDDNKKLAKEILDFYNEETGKNLTSTVAIEDNLGFWLKQYSIDKIKEAITKIKDHDFWKDKMSLVILFRQKNPKGERVDYIADLLNYGLRKKPKFIAIPKVDKPPEQTPEERKRGLETLARLRQNLNVKGMK